MRISDWSSDVCSSDLDELGPIQILVNNAGVAATAPFLDMTEQDWAQVLDTNLTGVWRVGQAVARRMAPLGRGSIINISSMALLQRLAAVRGRLSLCADQAAAAKWWLSMPMASVSAEGPMPKALSTRRTSPLMPGCRHRGRACPLRRARMTSNPLIVA